MKPQTAWDRLDEIRRPLSLLELMEIFKPEAIIELLHTLLIEAAVGTDDSQPLPAGRRSMLLRMAKGIREESKRLGLVVTENQAELLQIMLQANPGKYETAMAGRASNSIASVLATEIGQRTFFALPRERAKYYSAVPLFGPEVDLKFSSIAFEIDEAGKCFALGRFTASVFHLMRLMEGGIGAVRQCLGLPDPIKPAERNWGKILEKIKTETDRRTAARPALWRVPGDQALFESAYVSLDAVRAAWRNTTMHVESKYTDEEAEHIFVSVRGFMKKLASRMKEDGLPLA